MPTSNTIDRELSEAKLENELRDEELEQVIGGSFSPISVTRKIDQPSPLFFKD